MNVSSSFNFLLYFFVEIMWRGLRISIKIKKKIMKVNVIYKFKAVLSYLDDLCWSNLSTRVLAFLLIFISVPYRYQPQSLHGLAKYWNVQLYQNEALEAKHEWAALCLASPPCHGDSIKPFFEHSQNLIKCGNCIFAFILPCCRLKFMALRPKNFVVYEKRWSGG